MKILCIFVIQMKLKMKSKFFGYLLLTILLASCQSKTDQIVGIYPDNSFEGKWVYLSKNDETKLDSAQIKTNNKGVTGFIMKSYAVPEAKDNLVFLVAPNGVLPIILEKNMISVDIATTYVQETPLNEALTLYRSKQILNAKATKDPEILAGKLKETAEQFLKTNKDNSVGVFILMELIYMKNTTDEDIKRYLSSVSDDVKNHEVIKEALATRQ